MDTDDYKQTWILYIYSSFSLDSPHRFQGVGKSLFENEKKFYIIWNLNVLNS